MRIISKIPVILMGQTGIGKTALIEFLSEIMHSKIYTINIYAGI